MTKVLNYNFGSWFWTLIICVQWTLFPQRIVFMKKKYQNLIFLCVCFCQLQIHSQPESRVFYLVGMLGLVARETGFQIAPRDFSEEAEERVRLYTSLQQSGRADWTSIIVKYGKPDTKLKECSTRLHMGRCKNLRLLKSFLPMHLSCLRPASCFFFFFLHYSLLPPPTTPNPRAPQQSPWRVGGHGIVSLFGSPHSHLEARNRWWLLHPCLLIWQEIFNFTVLSFMET